MGWRPSLFPRWPALLLVMAASLGAVGCASDAEPLPYYDRAELRGVTFELRAFRFSAAYVAENKGYPNDYDAWIRADVDLDRSFAPIRTWSERDKPRLDFFGLPCRIDESSASGPSSVRFWCPSGGRRNFQLGSQPHVRFSPILHGIWTDEELRGEGWSFVVFPGRAEDARIPRGRE